MYWSCEFFTARNVLGTVLQLQPHRNSRCEGYLKMEIPVSSLIISHSRILISIYYSRCCLDRSFRCWSSYNLRFSNIFSSTTHSFIRYFTSQQSLRQNSKHAVYNKPRFSSSHPPNNRHTNTNTNTTPSQSQHPHHPPPNPQQQHPPQT